MTVLTRRGFVVSIGAAGGAVILGGATPDSDTPWAGEKIVDCHFHDRPTDEGLIAHLDGAGITSALVLTGVNSDDRFRKLNAQHPHRIAGWAMTSLLAADDSPKVPPIAGISAVTSAQAVAVLRGAVAGGAKGFAETVGVVAVDGPELRRLYALAAELDVPVMMHFQEGFVPGLPRYGITGFSRIATVLKEFPKTRFVCHASDFWGNIDAKYRDGTAYPMGKVNRGGLTEHLLAEYPNMFGDLSAPSGLIQLMRDPDFTAGFLERHQDKLIFGSDCGCPDGKGGSIVPAGAATSAMQTRMAAAGGLSGKCIARELLKITWSHSNRKVFRKLAWKNAHRVYKLGHA